MKLIKPKIRNSGDKVIIKEEILINEINFNILKYNKRARPEKNGIIIVCTFCEFGCESLIPTYCLPAIMEKQEGYYYIVVGWYGRKYLYAHLADEYWEIKEENMWLREYAKAFHHNSKNLKLIENNLSQYGHVIKSEYLGRYVIGATCNKCKNLWASVLKESFCPKCKSQDLNQSLFGDVKSAREKILKLPMPSSEKMKEAEKYVNDNTVGIFARNRISYGRNLQIEFYEKVIELLKKYDYNIIWLGEKVSTYKCPDSSIIDFSRMEESKDLELTLAIVSKLKFTVQWWTASTRLSIFTGTPWILFESPEQIFGSFGQEGFRLNLLSQGKGKLVLSHYKNLYENNYAGINVLDRAIKEIRKDNFEEIFDLLEYKEKVIENMENNIGRIGGQNWKSQ